MNTPHPLADQPQHTPVDTLWKQAFAFAHCACEPDEDGVVRYHSNCARKLRPILTQLQALAGIPNPADYIASLEKALEASLERMQAMLSYVDSDTGRRLAECTIAGAVETLALKPKQP